MQRLPIAQLASRPLRPVWSGITIKTATPCNWFRKTSMPEPATPALAASVISRAKGKERMAMFPTIIDGNSPTNTRQIEEFERERGLSLPSLYKEFLLATNGGVPENPAFPIRGMSHNPIGIVQVFLGIGVRWPTTEISYAYDLYAGGFPKGIVPIADNGTGDYVCLDLRSGHARVAFWDKRHFWGTGEWRESDLYHVASSFEEFLASLRPNPY